MGESEVNKDAKMIFVSDEGEVELELDPIEISFTKTDLNYEGECR